MSRAALKSGHAGDSRPSHSAAVTSRTVLLPDHYCWIILLGSLDIMFTWIVLKFGGYEANAIAAMALALGGKWGLITLKFVAVCVVIAICEYIGRVNHRRAVQVADIAIALNALPVLVAITQLLIVGWQG